MKNEIENLIRKAERSLKAARRLAEEGDYDFSVSRSYYAMFYLTKALLLTKKKKVSSHHGLIATFGVEFAKTGILPARLHKWLIDAFEERSNGDYTLSEISEQTVEANLKRAKEFYIETTEYLKTEGYYEE